MIEQLGLLEAVEADYYDPMRDGLLVRESRRARRLILQLVPPHTLEVVVPKGTRPRVVERFVRENRLWIERARAELATRFRGSREQLPTSIALPALARSVAIEYVDSTSRDGKCGWREAGERLVVRCPASDRAAARALLRKWLLENARIHLKPWLLHESAKLGDAPRKIQVRLQRTRWGSCSANGTISLNAGLLLLEPALVRYLMVHELCHLRRLDHSARYWSHVERFVPDYRDLDRRLAGAWTEMPLWITEVKR